MIASYILIYFPTARDKNQSDNEVEPEQEKQKFEDGEFMLYSIWGRHLFAIDMLVNYAVISKNKLTLKTIPPLCHLNAKVLFL